MVNERLLALGHATAKASLLPNMRLKAQSNSPLEHIVKNCMPAEGLLLATESVNQSLSMVNDKANLPFAFSGSKALPLLLEEMDDTYIKPLVNQVNFVRNVVNPIIREVVEKVETNLKGHEARSSAINILKLEMPDFVYGQLGAYVNKFALTNGLQKGPSFQPDLPSELAIEDIVEMAKTSSPEVNEGLMELSAIWNDLFDGNLFQTAYQELLLKRNEVVGSMPVNYRSFMLASVAFFIADNLVKNPIKGLTLDGANLAVWGDFFRASCARVIQSMVNMATNAITNNILIYSVNPDKDKKEITVYGKVFDEFDNADKIEIMVGILNSENPMAYRTIGDITENMEILLNRGQFVLSADLRVSQSRKIARLFDAIHGSTIQLIEETINSEEESDLRVFIPTDKKPLDYRSEINRFLESRYPGINLLKNDLKIVVSDLVCELFFKETMAQVIIQRIIQIELANPNASQASVITQSMIDVLCEWVGGQIEVHER